MPNPAGAPKPKFGLALAALVVLLAVAYIVWMLVSPKSAQAPQNGNAPAGSEQAGGDNADAPAEIPSDIRSYAGQVKSATAQTVVIVVPQNESLGFEADTEITASIDASTQVVRRTLPLTPPEPGTTLPQPVSIKVTDLKVGETVTIVGAENLRGKTQFVATRIEAVSFK